jgi:hypothetical protein
MMVAMVANATYLLDHRFDGFQPFDGSLDHVIDDTTPGPAQGGSRR